MISKILFPFKKAKTRFVTQMKARFKFEVGDVILKICKSPSTMNKNRYD